jgi:16S rRNA (guanine527-N7)-methyltransferase
MNDSSQKKCAFMRQAVIELGFHNVAVHEGRVERWRPEEKFGLVISRAFASLERFVALCSPLVAAGGVLAAMTGAKPGTERCTVFALRVPGLEARRHLALCAPIR